MNHLHFIGIAGTGMSALAQFQVMGGNTATGSDRYFDRNENQTTRDKLLALGIGLFPQDGSGITPKTNAVVVSTAIEESNPEIARARALNIPVLHRSQLLARFVAQYKTIAVAGTSGKSTVTAMVYEILAHAGLGPSVITGGNLVQLEQQGLIGNAFKGSSDLLVIEADESDGSLTAYHPQWGLVLNLDKDHKEIAELTGLFSVFAENCRELIVNGDRPDLVHMFPQAITFGLQPTCAFHAENVVKNADSSKFTVQGKEFFLPIPGQHNIENALAAITVCFKHKLSLAAMAAALQNYQGVARRFQKIGTVNNITVIDDFAHNPAKIKAVLETAFLRGQRVLAVYQPHGFGPTKFLKDDLIKTFTETLRADDILYMPEIYYAGGTAQKTVSSRDIVDAVAQNGRNAFYFEKREAIIAALKTAARPGDLVLVMGARDPGVPGFCREVVSALR
jgi:UDP-N-acetylmuramate--alanine ligase